MEIKGTRQRQQAPRTNIYVCDGDKHYHIFGTFESMSIRYISVRTYNHERPIDLIKNRPSGDELTYQNIQLHTDGVYDVVMISELILKFEKQKRIENL